MNNSTLPFSKKAKMFVALCFLSFLLSSAIPHDTTTWKIIKISVTILSIGFGLLAYFSKEENRTTKGYLFILLMAVIAITGLLYPFFIRA